MKRERKKSDEDSTLSHHPPHVLLFLVCGGWESVAASRNPRPRNCVVTHQLMAKQVPLVLYLLRELAINKMRATLIP